MPIDGSGPAGAPVSRWPALVAVIGVVTTWLASSLLLQHLEKTYYHPCFLTWCIHSGYMVFVFVWLPLYTLTPGPSRVWQVGPWGAPCPVVIEGRSGFELNCCCCCCCRHGEGELALTPLGQEPAPVCWPRQSLYGAVAMAWVGRFASAMHAGWGVLVVVALWATLAVTGGCRWGLGVRPPAPCDCPPLPPPPPCSSVVATYQRYGMTKRRMAGSIAGATLLSFLCAYTWFLSLPRTTVAASNAIYQVRPVCARPRRPACRCGVAMLWPLGLGLAVPSAWCLAGRRWQSPPCPLAPDVVAGRLCSRPLPWCTSCRCWC
jgi:hypothetical protein